MRPQSKFFNFHAVFAKYFAKVGTPESEVGALPGKSWTRHLKCCLSTSKSGICWMKVGRQHYIYAPFSRRNDGIFKTLGSSSVFLEWSGSSLQIVNNNEHPVTTSRMHSGIMNTYLQWKFKFSIFLTKMRKRTCICSLALKLNHNAKEQIHSCKQ